MKLSVFHAACQFPGPFVREGVSPSPSPLLHRAMPNVRAVTKSADVADGPTAQMFTPPTSPQLSKLIIRAARSPDRATSPDYVRRPATVVGPTSPTSPHRQVRGAYVNMQGDEGKTTSSVDEQRDCTGRTGRLEAPRTPAPSTIAPSRSKNARQSSCNLPALAPSNKLPETDKSIDKTACHGGWKVDRQTKRKPDRDENHPPQLNGDALETNRLAIAQSKINHSVGSNNSANSRLDFEKSGLCPKILRATGNTPKLGRKLLVSDLDTPSFFRKRLDLDSQNVTEESAVPSDCDTDDKNASGNCADGENAKSKVDRKVKRSESYRMANSPIMFIKRFSAGSQEKSSKICRTPSEELQEELLRERINYPETVSSPEPQVDNTATFDMNLTAPVSVQSVPTSPRPRALDLEPVRVLKYSSNDTEIW